VLSRDYVSGETLFYLGRRYVLKLVPSDDERHVKLLRGQIRVTGPDLTRERVRGTCGFGIVSGPRKCSNGAWRTWWVNCTGWRAAPTGGYWR
jgi:hypothetical protein